MSIRVPKEHPPQDVLTRIADRMEVGGVCESLLAQLELDEPLTKDEEQMRSVLLKAAKSIVKIMEQSLSLEQELAVSMRSLGEEKRINLDLKVINRKLTERNAEVSKENRNLKQEISKWFEADVE